MVNIMLDEWDPDIAAAFGRAHQPLGRDRFMVDMLRRIERTQRIRLWRRSAAIAAVLAAVAFNLRPIITGTAGALRIVGDFSPAYAQMLITPGGWAVSMLVGAWVLFRTRPSRG